MSAKGDCWDNSPTERFFKRLKSEYLSYDNLKTKEMAKLSIIDYIAFYNGQRLYSTLNYQSSNTIEACYYKEIV